MKKLISILLVATMLISTVMVSAFAGTTGQNIITVDGVENSVSVGDILTYCVYLNVSDCTTDGKIASIDCEIEYSTDVLELQLEYDEYGDLIKEAHFPVLGPSVVFNSNANSKIRYNYSYTEGTRFNSDDKVLCIFSFKVIAEGDGSIVHRIRTMAKADKDTTKIVFAYETLEEYYIAQAIEEIIPAVPSEPETDAPTDEPSEEPTQEPTEPESEDPSDVPTVPDVEPTDAPSEKPTEPVTEDPTDEPSEEPTEEPTEPESEDPSDVPTVPDVEPTDAPSEKPTEPVTEEPTDEPDYLLGDVDNDGRVTVFDATTIQLYCAKYITFTDEQLLVGDVDKDGKVSVFDATTIQLYCAKYITEF